MALDVPGPLLLSSSTEHNSARAPTPNNTPQPSRNPIAAKPNYDPFASLTSSYPTSRSSTPSIQQPQNSSSLPNSSDPFSILASPPLRQASPFSNPQQSNLPVSVPPGSIFDFSRSSQSLKPPTPQPNSSQDSNGPSVDEDWDFTSALPEENSILPSSNHLVVSNTAIAISFQLSRPKNSDSEIAILVHISNNTSDLITEYAFHVAVSKVDFHHPSPIQGRLTRFIRAFHCVSHLSLDVFYTLFRKMPSQFLLK